MRNTSGIVAYQKKRYREMSEKLRIATLDLRNRNKPVTIRAVSKKAGVARVTVYRHPEVVDLIRAYRSG